MSTFWFDIPESGKALPYYNCVKKLDGKILHCNEFLPLITSIVTDGENLNFADKKGRCVRLQREASLSSNKPLFSIWFVDYRFNLAWKDVHREIE